MGEERPDFVPEEEELREKDNVEKELEKAVFGESSEFRANLKGFALQNGTVLDADDGQTGLEAFDDADLFFTDLTASNDNSRALANAADDEDDTLRSQHPTAWEDSDDERMMISLASVPRLRKLRRTEAEDVVNGKEYMKRLRRQFESLHPAPAWAREALKAPTHSRRQTIQAPGSDGEMSTDEMDLDEDVPSAAPLSKLMQNAGSLVRTSRGAKGRRRKLHPEVLDVQRTDDIPGIQPSAITSLSFHPKLPLLLSSGPSSTLYLHHITPSPPADAPNPLLTSMHIHGAPLSTTAFHPTDDRIFLSAPRRFFHIWNLNSGLVEKITRVYGHQPEQRRMERFKLSPNGTHMALLGTAKKGGGVINILDSSTLQWTMQARVESRGGIADFCWWQNSKGLCIAGKNGEVTEWSAADRSVVARWQDEGAVGTTTIALGGQHEFHNSVVGTDRWIATGSSSGIVNVYDRRAWSASPVSATFPPGPIPAQPKPTKVLDHLTTPTSHLTFSPDGQVLAMASKWKRDALRLVHMATCTVYRNWPTSKTPLGRITSVAFAAGELMEGDVHSLLAVANEQGKIRCWEIR